MLLLFGIFVNTGVDKLDLMIYTLLKLSNKSPGGQRIYVEIC